MPDCWWKSLKEELKVDSKKDSQVNVHEFETGFSGDIKGLLGVGRDTRISNDAILNGSIIIGSNCMIGNGVIIRGNVRIYDNVRIGYGAEIKDSVIRENTTIGPLCYLGDSLVEKNVYLGALVRTSNHRLDGASIKSWNGEKLEDTGWEKLGAWIRENTSLGVGVVILPGRIVPENSMFTPNIVITKNYSPGTYNMVQNIVKVD